ncbi:unnamed protein product [Pylaiella littoralis]
MGPAAEEVGVEGPGISPPNPGTDDEGYHPKGEEEGGRTQSGSSSSSDSESGSSELEELEEHTQQQLAEGRRASIAGDNRGQRRVSYADDRVPHGSVSMPGGEREGTGGGGRRTSTQNGDGVAASGRRRSTKTTAPIGGSSGGGGRRRSSAAFAAISDQGLPGRRGSMFEGMQVYAPDASNDAGSSRRRSTRKGSSRVTAGDRSSEW